MVENETIEQSPFEKYKAQFFKKNKSQKQKTKGDNLDDLTCVK